MSHYFTPDASLPDRDIAITYGFKGRQYSFTSNAGVFSATRIDDATDLLLQTLPPLTGSLLDMGCGYGCIGIVLAKTYNLTLTQVDVNPRALALTTTNCAKNDVASTVLQSNGFDAVPDSFDTVVINPPIHAGKGVVFAMYEGAHAHLNPNGRLFIVILKKHGAESSIAKLTQLFGHCDILYKKKGTYVLQTTLRN